MLGQHPAAQPEREPPIATQISVSSYGLSPLFFAPGSNVPGQLPQQTLLIPEHSEVLLPLSRLGQANLAELFNADVHHESRLDPDNLTPLRT